MSIFERSWTQFFWVLFWKKLQKTNGIWRLPIHNRASRLFKRRPKLVAEIVVDSFCKGLVSEKSHDFTLFAHQLSMKFLLGWYVARISRKIKSGLQPFQTEAAVHQLSLKLQLSRLDHENLTHGNVCQFKIYNFHTKSKLISFMN